MAVVRSGGVMASAIVALLGSVMTAGVAVLTIISSVALNRADVREALARQPQAPPISPMVMMIGMSGVLLAFAIWGISSAIAILRLKTWGRTSFVVFGGMLVVFGAVNVLGSLLVAALMSSMPFPDPPPPRELMTGILAAMALASLAVAGVGVWWLIFFNRGGVKAQFRGAQAVANDTVPIPMRVLFVAWFLVSAAFAAPIALASQPPMPVFMLGMELHGWPASLIIVCQLAVTVAAGIGLLRRRFSAHALAIGVVTLGLINFALIAAVPGRLTRLLTMYQSAGGQGLPPQFMDSMASWIVTVGLCANVAFIAVLGSARGAYRRACTTPH